MAKSSSSVQSRRSKKGPPPIKKKKMELLFDDSIDSDETLELNDLSPEEKLDQELDLPFRDDSTDSDDDGLDPEGESNDFSDLSSTPLDQSSYTDIFSYAEQYVAKGRAVQYTIKRNGSWLCVKNHPYSWELLQKEYGGGSFHIVARDKANGRIIKQTHESLSELESQKKESSPAPVSQPHQAGMSMTEILALLQTQAKSAKEEAAINSNALTQMITTLLTVQQQASAQVMAMQQESQRQMQIMMEKAQESTNRLIEKMQDNTTRMFEKFERKLEKPSDEGINTVKLIELMSQSEEKGRKLTLEIYKKAEEEARQKSEFMEELRSEFGSKDKSMTDKLIESILPIIATGAVNKSLTPQTAMVVPPVDPISQTEMTAQSRRQYEERMKQERERQAKLLQPNKNTHVPKGFGVHQSTPKKPMEVSQVMTKKEMIESLLVPHFGSWLTTRQTEAGVRQSVQDSLEILKKAGISRDEVIKEFSFEDLKSIVKRKLGLSAPLAMPWFEVYDRILREDRALDERVQESIPEESNSSDMG